MKAEDYLKDRLNMTPIQSKTLYKEYVEAMKEYAKLKVDEYFEGIKTEACKNKMFGFELQEILGKVKPVFD